MPSGRRPPTRYQMPIYNSKRHIPHSMGSTRRMGQKTSSSEIGQAINLLLSDYRNSDRSQTIYTTWSPLLKETITNQYRLGHRAFMEGILCHDWVEAQEAHLLEQNDKRRSAEKWCAILTTKIWDLAHIMWTNRNDVLHKNEEAQKQLLQESHIKQLQLLYSKKDRNMPHIDQRLFQRPLNEALMMKPCEQRQLIRQLNAAVTAHERRKKRPEAQAFLAWLNHPA